MHDDRRTAHLIQLASCLISEQPETASRPFTGQLSTARDLPYALELAGVPLVREQFWDTAAGSTRCRGGWYWHRTRRRSRGRPGSPRPSAFVADAAEIPLRPDPEDAGMPKRSTRRGDCVASGNTCRRGPTGVMVIRPVMSGENSPSSPSP